MVVLPECKREPTKEENRGALYCQYQRRSDHHTMDCYALKNIFHEKVAKGDFGHQEWKVHRSKTAQA